MNKSHAIEYLQTGDFEVNNVADRFRCRMLDCSPCKFGGLGECPVSYNGDARKLFQKIKAECPEYFI
jgi:hypothetical protein